MRPIKFRGHNFFTGEFVYAQQIRSTDDGFDFWVNDDWIHCTDCAQLVGYDVSDKEVYEGDKVISRHGYTDAAEFRTYPTLKYFKLKEAQS